MLQKELAKRLKARYDTKMDGNEWMEVSSDGMSNLRWFAAFHNESHHPHIHLIAYSTNPNEGYLSEKGVMALRSSFAKDIFAQDLLCEYKKQTEHRDALKVQSREVLAELIAKINSGTYDNPQVEDLLQTLAKRLAVTNGKKQYGYLRKDIKEIINSIVDELGKDERIAALYDLWYESKETALKVYTESRPERLPLSQNKEFKSVKNMVIAEAMKLNLPTDEVEDTDESVEPDREPTTEEAESPDPPPPPMDEYEKTVADADKGNKWSQYRAAKFMLDRDGDHYDPKKAIEYLTRSAKQGYTVAKYMLGKLYLKGEDIPKQMLHALHWLESAVKDDNQYAEYLLGKVLLKGDDVERDTERAESLLRRSAEQENKYAAYTLGKAYLDGDILAQNIDEAVRLLNLSASRNFAPAQFILGRLLYKGEVIPKDIKKAAEWLDRAAAQKNPYAAYLAGKIYLTEDEVKNVQKAIRRFMIAAENGNDYAEYQLGKIYLYGKDIGGKSYAAGTFAVLLLNQYFENDTAARIAVYKANNLTVQRELEQGYINPSDFFKCKDEIQAVLKTLSTVKPFSMLDTDNERNRISDLFTYENAESIADYFRRRASVANMDVGAIALGAVPKEYDKEPFAATEALLSDIKNTLTFYDTVSEDMRKAFEKLREFSSRVDEASRFDETNLLPVATGIFGCAPFPVKTEYVSIQKTRTGKTLVTAGRMYFESYYSFIVTDFFEGLHYGHYPRQCPICKKYFLMQSAARQKYCNGYAPFMLKGKPITCRKYVANTSEVIRRKHLKRLLMKSAKK